MSTLACEHSNSCTTFQLIDAHGAGEPYAGVAFDVVDREGGKHSGYLDQTGSARLINLVGGAVRLLFTQPHDRSDPLYSQLMDRAHYPLKITELQVRAERTRHLDRDAARAPNKPAHLSAGHDYYQVEVRHLVEHVAHLPPELECHFPADDVARPRACGRSRPGLLLAGNHHSVLQIRPLRALRPMLSTSPQFCALNLYQLALMSTLGHCPFGQASGTPSEQSAYAQLSMGDWQVNPEQAKRYYPLYEDVPYSRRFEIVPFDPVLYPLNDPLLEAAQQTPANIHFLGDIRFGAQGCDAQTFVTHHDEIILIAVRSTRSWSDISCDADVLQVQFEEGEGKVHGGFYQAARQAYELVSTYLDKFYAGQKILVCGHSTGGAIGLILAQMLRKRSAACDVQLYTYGAPRAADATFVKDAGSLVHHRMVNHDDPVPCTPGGWMNTRLSAYGAEDVFTFERVPEGFGAFVVGLNHLTGELYQHHGNLQHFMPVEFGQGQVSHVMWGPVSDTVTQHAVNVAVLEHKCALPGRDGPLKELVSVGQQFMLDSYIPSCWAALRRYQQALEGKRSLVTEREVMFIDRAFESIAQQLRGKYQQQMTRPGSKTHGQVRTVNLLMREISKVHMTRERLYCLRFKVPGPASVYGQFALHPEALAEGLARWLAHSESLRADQLAMAPVEESLDGLNLRIFQTGRIQA